VRDHVLITIVSLKGASRRDVEPGDVTADSGTRIAGTHPQKAGCQLCVRKMKS